MSLQFGARPASLNPVARSAPRGFHLTDELRLVCADLVSRLPELSHIDLARVAIGFSQARRAVPHGLQATLTPLRFENGAETTLRRGRRYGVERLYDAAGREYLYILRVYVPRFLNHVVREKIATLVHELWHISPRFDGDLRRFAGRCYAHGSSQHAYEQEVIALADRWWQMQPPAEVHDWLRHDFAELQRRFGRVLGLKIPAPRLILVE